MRKPPYRRPILGGTVFGIAVFTGVYLLAMAGMLIWAANH